MLSLSNAAYGSALASGGFLEAVYDLFNPDLSGYEYINVGSGGFLPIVIGLLVGFFLACCATVFDRRVLGDFVRHVISNECFSKESAKTLTELGYHKNAIIRGSLKSGVSLRRVVKCVEEEQFLADVEKKRKEYEAAHANDRKAPAFKAPKFVMDASVMHFYIPEDLKYTADVKFEKKGTNALTLAVAFVLFLAIALVVLYLLPDILQMIDNMLGMMDSKNNIVT